MTAKDMKKKTVERRKFMRIEDTLLTMNYEILECRPGRIKLCLKDLNREGLRISSKDALPKDADIRLRIKLPISKKPIVAFGKVIWTRKADNSSYDSGIHFTHIRNSDKAELLGYVYDEWKKRLR